MTAYTKQHNSSFVNDSHLISSLQSWVSKKEVRMHTKKDYYNVQMLFQTWKNSANYGKHLLTKTKKLQTSETVFSVHWINHIGWSHRRLNSIYPGHITKKSKKTNCISGHQHFEKLHYFSTSVQNTNGSCPSIDCHQLFIFSNFILAAG